MATRKQWVYDPPKPTIPAPLKAEVTRLAEELIEKLKPLSIVPQPADFAYGYIVDLHGKWHGRFYHFIATYHYPSPTALSPSRDVGFARLEYAGDGRFNLAYFRHTGKWFEIYRNLTPSKAMEEIEKTELLWP